MIDLGPHASFILAAYAGVALTTIALIAATVLAARRQQRRLDALDAAGIKRRSAKPNGSPE